MQILITKASVLSDNENAKNMRETERQRDREKERE